jgi:5-formyltetrahydrofolate cyclo-ligase
MGPLGFRQPKDNLSEVIPDTLFVPLIGFTERGGRLGQGGGHYDRWLAEHPETRTIGLAWDCQLVEELPTEAHDIDLNAIVTPTRFYGPF